MASEVGRVLRRSGIQKQVRKGFRKGGSLLIDEADEASERPGDLAMCKSWVTLTGAFWCSGVYNSLTGGEGVRTVSTENSFKEFLCKGGNREMGAGAGGGCGLK